MAFPNPAPPSDQSSPQTDTGNRMSENPQPPLREPILPKDATVLIVEDNVSNFVLMARMLAYMGVPRCEWKTSGWQVVEFADTLPKVDLILMDIRLPYEDGYAALGKVRATRRLKDTIIVAVTAEASQEQMAKARAAGFDGFLGKPIDPDRFPDQIRRLLKGEAVWEMS
jgi:two-component system, cell cycle response regulator DivK